MSREQENRFADSIARNNAYSRQVEYDNSLWGNGITVMGMLAPLQYEVMIAGQPRDMKMIVRGLPLAKRRLISCI